MKSRDIDLYIDQDNFYKLQEALRDRGFPVRKNPRLRKFEAVVEDVEIDIYTPFLSRLLVPCAYLMERRLYSLVEGFQVAIPEVLLLLKAQAAKERWHSEKGMKDRIDIISLLAFGDIKPLPLKDLIGKYDPEMKMLEVVAKTLRQARSEYRYSGLSFERDGPRLKQSLEALRG